MLKVDILLIQLLASSNTFIARICFYLLNLSVNSEQKHSVGGRIMPFES